MRDIKELFKCGLSFFSHPRKIKIHTNTHRSIKFHPTDVEPISISSDGFIGCDGTIVHWVDEHSTQHIFGAHYSYLHKQHCEIVQQNLKQIRFENKCVSVKKATLITFNVNHDDFFKSVYNTSKIEHDHRRQAFIDTLEAITLKTLEPNEFQKFPITYSAPPFGRSADWGGTIMFTLDKDQSTCKFTSVNGITEISSNKGFYFSNSRKC